MIRLNLVLLVAVMASALYLVHSQYESRRLVTELHEADAEARALEIEKERLQLEKRAQATPQRVQKLAREQLQMRLATPAITQYVAYAEAARVMGSHSGLPGTPAAATGASASASGAVR